MKKARWFFILRKLVNRISAGTFQSTRKGAGGVEFAGYREFQPGDSVRSISYKESLKHFCYYARDNIIEKSMICLFVVDRSASINFGPSGASKKEIQNKILEILAPAIAQENNQIGFMLVTDCIERYFKPRFGENAIYERLISIIKHHPESKLTNLDAVFRTIFRMNIPADLIFIISDFYSPVSFENSLKILSKKYDVIPILLKDPFETTTFPKIKGGMIAFRDLETGEFFWGEAPKKISNKVLFEKLGLDFLLLKTNEKEVSWEEKLRILFEQRKRRRRIR